MSDSISQVYSTMIRELWNRYNHAERKGDRNLIFRMMTQEMIRGPDQKMATREMNRLILALGPIRRKELLKELKKLKRRPDYLEPFYDELERLCLPPNDTWHDPHGFWAQRGHPERD